MPDATFDGDNLLMTSPAATTVIDVERDFFSAWMRWLLLDDNRRYEPAFGVIFSDDVVEPILESGAYFFFRNDLGWRLRGPDEDITVSLIGNFVPRATATEVIVPRVGRTIAFLGIQPITQGANLMTQIVEGSYTVQDSLKISNSALAALVSGVTTSQEKFRDLQDLRDRITVNFDANGNRTSVTLDLT